MGLVKNKPELTKEQTDALLAAANAARKGEKLDLPLILIIAISALGLIVYIYTAIAGIGTRAPLSYFPLFMYILMYISIIRYTISYFAKGQDVSMDGMLMRYCALTAASIVIGGAGIGQGLLTADVMILVLVPLMRENLINAKKSIILGVIIAVLVIAAAVIKFTANAETFSMISGIALFAAVFDSLNPTIQWLLFLALYLIRCKKGFALLKQIKAQQEMAEPEGETIPEAAQTTSKESAAEKDAE